MFIPGLKNRKSSRSEAQNMSRFPLVDLLLIMPLSDDQVERSFTKKQLVNMEIGPTATKW